jgi:hypothetical protein
MFQALFDNPNCRASAASMMFLTLLECVGDKLLEPALDNNIEDLAASLDARAEPDFRALYTVQNVSSLVAYVQEHFQNTVVRSHLLICHNTYTQLVS